MGRPIAVRIRYCSQTRTALRRRQARFSSARLGSEKELIHDSIIGTRFIGRVKTVQVAAGGVAAIIPEIEGMAYVTGEHTFTLDPLDALSTGFVLR